MKLPGTCLIIFIAASILTGCSDYRELEQRGFVIMLGIDKTEDDKYKVMMQLPVYGGGSEKRQPGYRIIESASESLYEAFMEQNEVLARELDLTSLETIVIGSKLAEDGIQDLEFLLRDFRIPRTTNITVTKGDAEEVLRSETPLFTFPALYPLYGLSKNWNQSMLVFQVPLWKLFNRYFYSKFEDPYLMALHVSKDYGITWGGIGLFNDKKLVGFLDKEQTRTFGLFESFGEERPVITKVNGEILSLEINQRKTKRNVEFTDGKVKLDIQVDIQGKFKEFDFQDEVTIRKESHLKTELEKQLTEEIKALIIQLQEKEIDPLGFGELARRKNMQMKDRNEWIEIYKEADVQIDVSITVLSSSSLD